MNTELVKSFMKVAKKHSPKSYLNHNMEMIVEPNNNIYFRMEDVETEMQLKVKVLSWLSRPSCKGVSNYWQYRVRNIVNEYLGTDFELRHMEQVYTRLGNDCNRMLCIEFIESNYDMRLLDYK